MNLIKAVLFIAAGLASAFILLAISSRIIGRPHGFYSFIATIAVWFPILFLIQRLPFFRQKTPNAPK